jgi:hypothetical protein
MAVSARLRVVEPSSREIHVSSWSLSCDGRRGTNGIADDGNLVLQQGLCLDLRSAGRVRNEPQFSAVRAKPLNGFDGGSQLQRDAYARTRVLEFGNDLRQEIGARERLP